jgi:hypothetical protein
MKTADHSLIAAVNHATDTLGLYRAELARILGLKCAEISDSRTLELILTSNTAIRNRAKLFIRFFMLLQTALSIDKKALRFGGELLLFFTFSEWTLLAALSRTGGNYDNPLSGIS